MSEDDPIKKLEEIYGHLSNKDGKTINEAMNALHAVKITDDDKKKIIDYIAGVLTDKHDERD